MASRLIAIAVTLVVCACASQTINYEPSARASVADPSPAITVDNRVEAASALIAALAVVEKKSGSIIVVLPKGTDAADREVFEGLRQVVSAADIPDVEGLNLPSGYFVLESFLVEGSTARLRGLSGPVPKLGMACGNGYDISLNRTPEGPWVLVGFTIRVC